MAQESNVRGIVFMILAMAAFSAADTLVKLSSAFLSPPQVMLMLLGGGLVVFATMTRLQGQRFRDRRAFAPALLVRYLSEIAGMVGMLMALKHVPLSTVGAITQATPIITTVGAVIFLRERVSWRRWSSIAVGFLGVMLIVRPGAEGFQLTILWAVLGLFALSIRDLTTRLVPQDMASNSLATYTMIAAVPFALAWVMWNGEGLAVESINWWIVLPMVCLGSTGYLLLIASLRAARVAVVMPFRYLRIIFLLVLGIMVFEERPDGWMLLGGMLIIASGIYMMWREHQIMRASAGGPSSPA